MSWFLMNRRRLLVPASLVAAAVLALALVYRLRQRPSADEQLRAIDAAHAIADEENAAQLYLELFQDTTRPSSDPLLVSQALPEVTLADAWRSADFPSVAQWIEDRRPTMDALLLASRLPRCWFPVSEDVRQRSRRFGMAYHGALLLLRAANNDLGEGRVEAGLEKLLGVLRMGEHFRAQLDPSDRETGRAVTAAGLGRLEELVVAGAVPPDWLARFEAALPPVEDTWSEDSRLEKQMNLLYMRQMRRNPGLRLLYTMVHGTGPGTKARKGQYHRQLAEFRLARILLELRRHRNQTGAWPANLDEIRSRVPPETFLDPCTGKPFDYRRNGGTFTLQTSHRGSIAGDAAAD